MSWKERSRMDERVLLVGEYLKGEVAMSLLAREFGISRKTAYKWVARYREAGPGGLADRSRAPLMHPRRVDPTAVEAVLMARRSHPHWGPRKILAWLAVKHPQLAVPVPSTVSAIFAKYGLSRARQARRRTPPYTDPFAEADAANRVWCTDFKGDFKTGDGRRCYPLTLTDAFSRALLRCTALHSPKTVRVRPVFEEAFREFGLPERIRTDNGTPFASRGAGASPGSHSGGSSWGFGTNALSPGTPSRMGVMSGCIAPSSRRPSVRRLPRCAPSSSDSMRSSESTMKSGHTKLSRTRRRGRATAHRHERTRIGCAQCSTRTISRRERLPPAVASVGAAR